MVKNYDLRSKIRSSGFLFIRSSGFVPRTQFDMGLLGFSKIWLLFLQTFWQHLTLLLGEGGREGERDASKAREKRKKDLNGEREQRERALVNRTEKDHC